MPSVQTLPFSHGSAAHSSMFVSQFAPLKPTGQAQLYEATPSVQTPPFWHGIAAHSSMFVSQFAPLKPAGHVQVYEGTPSVQMPPFTQGFAAHSLSVVNSKVEPTVSFPKEVELRTRAKWWVPGERPVRST